MMFRTFMYIAVLVALPSLSLSAGVTWSTISGPVSEVSTYYNHIGTDGASLYVVFQGGQFWKYSFVLSSPTVGSWTRLANPTRTVCSANSYSDLAYQNGYLYTSGTNGSNRLILRYHIPSDTWETWLSGSSEITLSKTTGNALFMDPSQPGVGYSASQTQSCWVQFDWNAKTANNAWMFTSGLGVTDAGWVSKNEDIATDGSGTYYATKNDKTAGLSGGDVVYTWTGLSAPAPRVLAQKPWQCGFAQSLEYVPGEMSPSENPELWLVRGCDSSSSAADGWGSATSDWARLDLRNVSAGWSTGTLPVPVRYNCEIVRVGGAIFVRGEGDKWYVAQVRRSNPVSDAKAAPDGAAVEVGGLTSAVFGAQSRFYIQSPSRSCGIQVRYSEGLPGLGTEAIVTGVMRTDTATRERYIEATGWEAGSEAQSIKPLGVTTRSLGGGTLGYQEGVAGATGLSNIGLLVRLCGKVTGRATDWSYVYVSDGGGATDGNTSGFAGVRIDLSAIPELDRPFIYTGDRLAVTGVSSMHASGSDSYRAIRVRSKGDITNYDDDGNRPIRIKVMGINFDPIIEHKSNKRLSQVYWPSHNPLTMAQYYMNDLKESSFNYAQYVIVEWVDVDCFPIKTDGFQYTDESYCYAWEHGGPFHSPDGVDYYKVIRDPVYSYNSPKTVAQRVAAGEIDEVFMFGAPYFGYWEAAMAGPSPYFINGGTYYVPEAVRNFPIMGFNYERWIGEMLEDFGHRAENHMRRVYGSWNAYPPQHNWDLFTLIDKNIIDRTLYTAGCGNVHFSPNSTADYQWGNYAYVWSTCDDWLHNWPNLQGTRKRVNCSEWGYGDIRAHHKWWLKHFPRTPGINPDGRQNNWWKYLVDFNSYPESR